MDPNVISSIIGAMSGVAAAFITAKLTTGAVKKQADRSAAINAAYLTTQIAPALRVYATSCIAVSHDDGEIDGQPAGNNGYCEVTVPSPLFKPSEFEVDWKALNPDLMADVLTFPEKAQDATSCLNERDYYDPPDHPDFFRERRRIYTNLGLLALDLADRLHAHSKLPTSEQAAGLRARLSERSGFLEAERERIDALRAKYHAESMASAPPVPPVPDQ